MHTQEQFIKNGVQTVSDGKLLVSGGAYFIGMSSDNQALKLKEGRSLKVSFPKISDEKMGLFYGERDSLGRMNWVDQKKELEEKIKAIKAKINSGKRGTIFKLVQDYTRDTSWNKQDSIIFRAIYKPMAINQLGWINCDRFFEVPNRTNLKIDFTNQNFIKSATMFVVFKDINSVVEDWYYFSGIENLSNYYQVPLDHNVRLIAFSFENNKIFTYSSDFKITKDHKVLIDLKESNEKELEKLFKIQ